MSVPDFLSECSHAQELDRPFREKTPDLEEPLL